MIINIIVGVAILLSFKFFFCSYHCAAISTVHQSSKSKLMFLWSWSACSAKYFLYLVKLAFSYHCLVSAFNPIVTTNRPFTPTVIKKFRKHLIQQTHTNLTLWYLFGCRLSHM